MIIKIEGIDPNTIKSVNIEFKDNNGVELNHTPYTPPVSPAVYDDSLSPTRNFTNSTREEGEDSSGDFDPFENVTTGPVEVKTEDVAIPEIPDIGNRDKNVDKDMKTEF